MEWITLHWSSRVALSVALAEITTSLSGLSCHDATTM
jgi:hypothetical protein